MLSNEQKHAYRTWRRRYPLGPARPVFNRVKGGETTLPSTPPATSGYRGTQDGKPILYWDGIEGIPFRNVRYADMIARGIDHTGWFCDSYQDKTLRGIVAQLPARSGSPRYLYGYESSDGECILYREVVADECDAARWADHSAAWNAERERDYQDAWCAGQEHGARVRAALDALRVESARITRVALYPDRIGLLLRDDASADRNHAEAREELLDALRDAGRAAPYCGSLQEAFRDGFETECGKIAKLGSRRVAQP